MGRIILALAVATACMAAPAYGQWCGGGGGGGASGGMSGSGMTGGTNSTDPTPATTQFNGSVKMKCFATKDLSTTPLKAVLEKVKGVSDVQFNDRERTVTFKYGGMLKNIVNAETAGANAGIPSSLITCARLILGFKAQKGADVAKLKAAIKGMNGVKGSDVGASQGEVFADLTEFSFEDLARKCEEAGFKVECKTHEAVDLTVKGDKTDDLCKDLGHTRGVLTSRSESGKIALVTLKKISDESFKKIAEKATMTIEAIARR